MGGFFRIPVIRTLHERQLLFPAVVVLIVAGVLVQGATVQHEPVRASSPDDLPRPMAIAPAVRPTVVRRPDLEKTPLTYFDDYWQQLRERVEDGVVLVGPEGIPAVVVMPGLALSSAEAGEAVLAELERNRLLAEPETGTNLAAQPDRPTMSGAADEIVGIDDEGGPVSDELTAADRAEAPNAEARPYGLIAVDHDRGLSLFEVDRAANDPLVLVPPAAVPSGSYVGAVTRDRSGRAAITPGHLVAARPEASALGEPSLALSMPVTGQGATAIVNLDGGLVGIAVGGRAAGVDGGGANASARLFSSSVVRRLVAELQRPIAPCRSLTVSVPEPDVLGLLGIKEGLLIERVRQDAFHPEPSLLPGDVILQWGGEPVTTVEAFQTRSDAVGPGELLRYRILRGKTQQAGGTIIPADDCQPSAPPPVHLPRHGMVLRWTVDSAQGTTEGWWVVATDDDGPAAAAGILVQDLLVAVDGVALDELRDGELLDRLAQRGAATLLTVRRADQVRMLALTPGDAPDD